MSNAERLPLVAGHDAVIGPQGLRDQEKCEPAGRFFVIMTNC
jgi:hypothetical protein